MFRSAPRLIARQGARPAALRASLPARRFISTAPPAQKSRSWKSLVARLGLAGAIIYYYNTTDIFAEDPRRTTCTSRTTRVMHTNMQQNSRPSTPCPQQKPNPRSCLPSSPSPPSARNAKPSSNTSSCRERRRLPQLPSRRAPSNSRSSLASLEPRMLGLRKAALRA